MDLYHCELYGGVISAISARGLVVSYEVNVRVNSAKTADRLALLQYNRS